MMALNKWWKGLGSINPAFRKRLTLVLALMVTLMITSGFFSFKTLRALEWKLIDAWVHQSEGSIPDNRVVVIGIDERAMAQFDWPLDRGLYAELLSYLRRMGAKVIAIDLLFDSATLRQEETDEQFLDEVSKDPRPILIYSPTRYSMDVRLNNTSIIGIDHAIGVGVIPKLNFYKAAIPYANLLKSNPYIAHHNTVAATEDGLLRGVTLVQSHAGMVFPAISLLATSLYTNEKIEYFPEINELTMGDYEWKLNGFASYYIDFRRNIKVFSLMDVFESMMSEDSSGVTVGEKELKDKVIYIGATDRLLGDNAFTPLSKGEFKGETPKVYLHALSTSALLDGKSIKVIGRLGSWLLSMAMLILLWFVFVFASPRKAFTTALVLGILLFFAQGLCYANDYMILCAEPITAIILFSLFGSIALFFDKEMDRSFLFDSFKAYLSEDVIDHMYKHQIRPQLGGSEGIHTAFFTDIQGFSTFSEQIGSASRLVELLNEYLTAMTDILMEHKGTLDKYEGDAIIAFFGAPIPMEDHSFQACRTALHMQEKLGELREYWKNQGDKWPEIVHHMRMRVGINTGRIVTGNMGSHMRMNYTMMGDAVNLAARLEGMAKQYGVGILVSQSTKDAAGPEIIFREIDRVRVVGKTESVTVYEPMAMRSGLADGTLQCKIIYEQGLEMYREQKWKEAQEQFKKSKELENAQIGSDPAIYTNPSAVFIKRCDEYLQKHVPIQADWDGVYDAQHK